MLRATLDISFNEDSLLRKYSTIDNYNTYTKNIVIAGHCYRSEQEIVKDVLLWTPNHGKTKLGRQRKNYVRQLCYDTGLKTEELRTAMKDRMKDRTTWK